jgi:hypothetical protein
MRVVSETPKAVLEKKRSAEKLAPALQKLAANMLRVLRGAGTSAEIYNQMSHAIDASDEYTKTHGHAPFASTIDGILHLDSPFEEFTKLLKDGRIRLFDVDRWMGDATLDEKRAIHKICRGALQKSASRLVKQPGTERMGEQEIEGGIRDYEVSRRAKKKKTTK